LQFVAIALFRRLYYTFHEGSYKFTTGGFNEGTVLFWHEITFTNVVLLVTVLGLNLSLSLLQDDCVL